MADESRPTVWGLWNGTLEEWFHPGTSKPYFPSKEEAHRLIPFATRQSPFGTWEVREYPLTDDEWAETDLGPDRAAPAPSQPGAPAS